ncbi:GNAT family N-acetyltransferase [Azospirillum canadense]|uniref:GNAT family N-acetyltransferase n=1 Tax=Azospirillum canadense TaxID=403962 RepID=UPI002225F089|nr:GNAT family N-acetyltransferase [Azospirillum canadense]MCW2241044.1 hypothetical protein [Azospirillum canadense]
MNSRPLVTSVVGPAALTPELRSALFVLLSVWFEGYGEDYFNEELADLDHCVLQRDAETGELVGFATIYRQESDFDGRAVGVYHTAHCILQRRYWGSNGLVRSMVAELLDRARADRSGRVWYWSYSAVGYRSYRYMPMLFVRHTPHAEAPLGDFDRVVRDWVGRECFAQYYDTETGTVDWNWQGYGLTEEARAISEAKLDSPALALFRRLNPRWADSVEILCQAQLHDDNLTPFARRWFPARQAA